MKIDFMPARLNQREAMRYSHYARLAEFKKWAELRQIPFTMVGKQRMFRVAALDAAMLADEQATAAAIAKSAKDKVARNAN